MEYTIHGLEAHAGVCPENGISAIQVAADAIASMKLGRIDHETTANIGLIEGGSASNIIPNRVVLQAEARSHSEEKLDAQTEHMRRSFQAAAARARITLEGSAAVTARFEERIERDYDRMDVPDDSPIVRLVVQAANNLNHTVARPIQTGVNAENANQRRGHARIVPLLAECKRAGVGRSGYVVATRQRLA